MIISWPQTLIHCVNILIITHKVFVLCPVSFLVFTGAICYTSTLTTMLRHIYVGIFVCGEVGGAVVGTDDGGAVGAFVGEGEGGAVGSDVGSSEGDAVGSDVGSGEGDAVGSFVEDFVGGEVSRFVGSDEVDLVSSSIVVGVLVGTNNIGDEVSPVGSSPILSYLDGSRPSSASSSSLIPSPSRSPTNPYLCITFVTIEFVDKDRPITIPQRPRQTHTDAIVAPVFQLRPLG